MGLEELQVLLEVYYEEWVRNQAGRFERCLKTRRAFDYLRDQEYIEWVEGKYMLTVKGNDTLHGVDKNLP